MKKILKIQIVTIIIGILVSYTNISMADNKTDLQNEKKDLNNSITQAQEELNDIKEEKSETLSQVEDLMSKISDYQGEIDELNTEISDLQSKIKSAKTKIEEDEKEYERLQQALNERLVTMYENGDTSYLDVILSSSNLTDFISSFYLVSELTNYDTDMLKQVEEEKNKIEKEKSELEASKASLDTAKKSKESKANALSVAKKEKEAKASQLTEDEKKTQAEIQEMLEDRATIDKELKKIAEAEAVAAKKAAEEAARKAAEAAKNSKKSGSNSSSSTTTTITTSSPSSSGYIFPVAGCSKANIRNKTYPSYAGHTGIDVNINVTGKSVVAVKGGTVVTSAALKNSNGSYRSYGEYVIINHHDGTITLYAHLLAGSRTVSAGATVSQGQVLGTVGSTGNSTGTHLHFEVRTAANSYKAVNPLPYLP